jgi:hypothetical protein
MFLKVNEKVLMHVYVTGSVTEKWAVFFRILFFWDVMLHLWVIRWQHHEGLYPSRVGSL